MTDRIEPTFCNDPVPSRELMFTIRRVDTGITVDFTRDGDTRTYVPPVTWATSAHGFVLEGLRRLADVEPDSALAVDDQEGSWYDYLTHSRFGGAERLIEDIPSHTVYQYGDEKVTEN